MRAVQNTFDVDVILVRQRVDDEIGESRNGQFAGVLDPAGFFQKRKCLEIGGRHQDRVTDAHRSSLAIFRYEVVDLVEVGFGAI